MRSTNEHGIALITTLLVTMLMSALLIGFTAVVMSDQRFRFIDRDRSQAFYAANGGIEKLTADLGNLFYTNVAPTAVQVDTLIESGARPVIDGVTFGAPLAAGVLPTSSLTKCAAPNVQASAGTAGYTIRFCAAPNGNPTTTSITPIKTGPYEGLIAQQTPYQLDVTARTASGGEAHLIRTIESVAIPVFQFGIFSDVDLSFSAAANFDFGGRVHTNNNLFIAESSGSTLWLRDKVTAVKDVIRKRLSNGVTIGAVGQTGLVNMATSPGFFRPLLETEGSVIDGVPPNLTDKTYWNEPTWHTTSLSAYNSWIRNGRTGARALNLPLITAGGSNPDLVKRAVVGEDAAKPILFGERLFGKASLRILLSDLPADITDLPTVTSTAPVLLDGDWKTTAPNNGIAYGPVDATHPPIARSLGPVAVTTTSSSTSSGASNITVNAVPAMFQSQTTLSVKTTAATPVFKGTIKNCATWTEDTFEDCTLSIALQAGWKVYIATTAGSTAEATGSMPQSSGGALYRPSVLIKYDVSCCNDRDVTSTTTTFGFTANTFFINAVNGDRESSPVTCTFATATQFRNCEGVPATSSGAKITTGYLQDQATGTAGGTLGGYIKMEKQNTDGSWTDVTMEILNRGVGGGSLSGNNCAALTGNGGDPTPNAIIRLQRLRDNGGATNCPITDLLNSFEWWPNVLFDAREALSRDVDPGNELLRLGGVMSYIAIDTANLVKWFRGTAPYNVGVNGTNTKTDNGGYTVYFSDRRNNRNALSKETGDYGWEDFVNPGGFDTGEDVNGDGIQDLYGGVPNYNGIYNSTPPGATGALTVSNGPVTTLTRGEAQVNRAVLFRRALKLIKGNDIDLNGAGLTGLTVVSENPVYIQGNWNAPAGNFTNVNARHAATAVIADTVAMLSGNWSDSTSFASPYDVTNRVRSANTFYRVAIISGKGVIFPKPGDVPAGSTFGTDGGAHSFLRMLEGGGGTTVTYRGSMATFYYNRQAVGPFKCCGAVVYSVPIRTYTFDADFLNPALLPPNTPMFRDMNAVGFAQEMRPGR